MIFNWGMAFLLVTAVLFIVSFIGVAYYLEQREPRLAAFYGFLCLVCLFILGGMAGCL